MFQYINIVLKPRSGASSNHSCLSGPRFKKVAHHYDIYTAQEKNKHW